MMTTLVNYEINMEKDDKVVFVLGLTVTTIMATLIGGLVIMSFMLDSHFFLTMVFYMISIGSLGGMIVKSDENNLSLKD